MGRKLEVVGVESRAELLARTPLFALLGRRERLEVAAACLELTYQRGDVVCRAGEEGDRLFVCASGQLDVWGEAPRRVINRLGAGECFGEMSLLLRGKRAATVTAARTTRLLALDRDGFERFFLSNPKALQYLSRLIGQRLAAMARGEPSARRSLTVGVVGSEGVRGKTLVATSLAVLLGSMTSRPSLLVRLRRAVGGGDGAPLSELARQPAETLLRRIDRGDAAVPTLSVTVAGTEGPVADLLVALVERLDEVHPYVVLDLAGDLAAVRSAVEGVAHVLVDVVARVESAVAPADPSRLRVLDLYNPQSLPCPIVDCDPFVLRVDRALDGRSPGAQARYVLENPRSPAGPALHRLARKILGASVGIVLGGGAAFGITHLGVLKVLEDDGIPVDLLVGCSMGSIVALGYAGGYRADEMIGIATQLGTRRNTLWAAMDLTLTRPAVLSGDRLVALFRPLYANYQRFEELTLPCRVVATDIETGERVALGSGDIESAGRASCSVPMLWPPVRRDGRVLVDGGVADPVPAEVARAMGADICIAVNAVPPLRKGVETVLTSAYRQVKRFDPLSYLAGSRGMPNLFDLVMSTMQTLQHELGDFKAISADVRLNPELSDLTWVEFYRPQEFIARGAAAAEQALPQIRRVLAERLAGPISTTTQEPPAIAEVHS